MSQRDDLTAHEAADLLKLSVSEIRALCRSGELICEKAGGRWVLSRLAVAEYLSDRLRNLDQS